MVIYITYADKAKHNGDFNLSFLFDGTGFGAVLPTEDWTITIANASDPIERRTPIEEFRGKLEETADSLRRRVAFASRAELADISAKLDELSKRVDALLKKRAKPA